MEAEGASERGGAYIGIEGITSIEFRRGHRIIVTYYNRSDDSAFLVARISFADADAPDPSQPAMVWHTRSHPRFKPEGEWMPPHALVELELYISDQAMRSSPSGSPSPAPIGWST